MDDLSVVGEIVALIVGISIGLAPFLIRFLLRRFQSARDQGVDKTKRIQEGAKKSRRPLPKAEAREHRREPEENNWIRRIQRASFESEWEEGVSSWQTEGRDAVPEAEGEAQLVRLKGLSETNFRDWDTVSASAGGWARISALPHWKRAIVLSELLQPPLSIRKPDGFSALHGD